MELDYFFNLFLIVSAIHGFVFFGIVLYSKIGNEKSMRYLALLVLMISLSNIQTWGIKPLLSEYVLLNYFYFPWHFLIGAYFYAFLVHYLQIEKKCFPVFKIVLPAFLITCVLRIIFHYCLFSCGEERLFWNLKEYILLEEGVSLLFSFGAFLYTAIVFFKRKELYTKVTAFDNLRWIYLFFKLGAITYSTWLIALFATIFINNFQFKYSYYPLKVFSAILIYWLGYQGFIQLRLLNERKEIRNKLHHQNNKKPLVVNTILLKNKFEEIDAYIHRNKRFTDPNLTLEVLAEELGMSSSSLSTIFNSVGQQSFPDFINYLRISAAKKMLTDASYSQYTIAAIGLESGFNSKSTFYTAFKKIANCTPLQYKNQQPKKA